MDPRQASPEAPPGAPPGAPRADLLQLARSLRAYVEELEACGSWGLPAAPASRTPPARSNELASGSPGEATSPATDGSPAPGLAPREPPAAPAGEAPSLPTAAAAGAVIPPRASLPRASMLRLEQLAAEASTCTRCGLHEGRRQSVFARGGGASGLVFVGEGPGEEEDRQGLPFVGPAGQLLDRMIAAMQFGRDDVYVCNIVKCRPPKNRKPEPDEMALCMPFLAEQLELLQPRVIVALGATAVQGLLGTTEGITRLRGQWKVYRGKIPVMPTFHPAYLLRTPNAKRDVWKDLQEVLRHMHGTAPRPDPG